jgi:hypothetical protein
VNVLAEQNNQVDTTIKAALKQLEKEAVEGMPDIETSWAKFETNLKEKQLKQKKHSYLKLAFVASLALVLLLSTQSEKVTAFGNEVYQWIGKDQEQGTIISEVENPAIEPGTYKDLSFDKAQEMTLFHLLKPEFLPAGIKEPPEIEMVVHEYPVLSVKMYYKGVKEELLIISQESSSGNVQKNTYIPENVECKTISLGGKNIIFINAESTIIAQWTENGIRYSVRSFGIKEQDVLKIIEHLKWEKPWEGL